MAGHGDRSVEPGIAAIKHRSPTAQSHQQGGCGADTLKAGVFDACLTVADGEAAKRKDEAVQWLLR